MCAGTATTQTHLGFFIFIQMNITIFPGANIPTNPTVIDSAEVVEKIKSGFWSDRIDKINTLPYNSAEQRELKKKLPAIVWQGVFNYRSDSGLIQHSGLIACDFDKIPEQEMQLYYDTLTAHESVYCLFRSPRRNGYKCIFRITADPEHHKAYALGLKELFRDSLYYDHFDDISRLCFVSSDEDIYFNPDAKIYNVKRYETNNTKHEVVDLPDLTDKEAEKVLDMLVKWLNKKLDYADGYKHTYLVKLYSALNRYGVNKDDAINLVYNHFGHIENVEHVSFNDFQKIANDIYKRYSHQHNISKYIEGSEPQHTEGEAYEINKIPFPIEVFPNAIQNLISELNTTMAFPKDFTAVAIMWAFATLNGNKYKLKVKNGWIAPSLFWFCVMGDSGTTKSHPLNFIRQPIIDIDFASKADYDLAMDAYKAADERGKKPKFKQIILNDPTIESLQVAHEINKRGVALFKDELISMFTDMNRYKKGSDEQFWLESFNNKSYVINRISREPVSLENIMITVLGGAQPDVISNIIADYTDSGFINRFLFTMPETNISRLNKLELKQDWIEWWEMQVRTINTYCRYFDSKDTVIVTMSDDAFNELIKIDDNLSRMQESDMETVYMRNYISKIKTYIPRFGLLIWLMDLFLITETEFIVSAEMMKRAEKLGNYFIESARVLFSYSESKKEMKGVEAKLGGKTKNEKILELAAKGFKGVEIAKQLNTSKTYVSRILAESKKKS